MTISKNTQKAKQAIANAKNVRCYALSNCFEAKLIIVPFSEYLAGELSLSHSKLRLDGSKYTLHVHSNLWYEFE